MVEIEEKRKEMNCLTCENEEKVFKNLVGLIKCFSFHVIIDYDMSRLSFYLVYDFLYNNNNNNNNNKVFFEKKSLV